MSFKVTGLVFFKILSLYEKSYLVCLLISSVATKNEAFFKSSDTVCAFNSVNSCNASIGNKTKINFIITGFMLPLVAFAYPPDDT